ncbi:MAG: site-2 protease family protein [Candidatus Hadarchaeota archaeon]
MSAREVGETATERCLKCGGVMKVAGEDVPYWLSGLLDRTSKHFEVEDFIATPDRAELEVSAEDEKKSFKSLLHSLGSYGYIPAMRRFGGSTKLVVLKRPDLRPHRVGINAILLVVTLISTFMAGYYFLPFRGDVVYSFAFSISIMLLLSAHELGHIIAARESGVDVSLPYFIPAPSSLGTFGALINVREPIPSRDELVRMGAAGPLVGFALAVPITLVGLMRSVPDASGMGLPFAPAAFVLLQLLVFGHVPGAMRITPLALAGWVAMVLTMFNLIPAGQLDGGHISRALMGSRRHYAVTRTIGFAFLLSGIFYIESPLWIWGFLILFLFRGEHTGPLDDVSRISRRMKKLALMSFIVFLLCLPVPIV